MKYKAFIVSETASGYQHEIQQKSIDDLPPGDVLIQVHYSSLNYKDCLSATINRGVTRKYPHTPGIDASGVVVSSTTPLFQNGDRVIVTGYDLGMNTSGGFQEYISVPKEWVVKCPVHLSLKDAMAYGTAGFTAALMVNKLIEQGITPQMGPVLVTGASGGVGSIACLILNRLGYQVIAASTKGNHPYFNQLGVHQVIHTQELIDESPKALLKAKWHVIIDTVGGMLLASLLKMCAYEGTIITCGNVGGGALNTTVYPFILRGVSLIGIDSVNTPKILRNQIWKHLATDWQVDLSPFIKEISLPELSEEIELMLTNQHLGRRVIHINAHFS